MCYRDIIQMMPKVPFKLPTCWLPMKFYKLWTDIERSHGCLSTAKRRFESIFVVTQKGRKQSMFSQPSSIIPKKRNWMMITLIQLLLLAVGRDSWSVCAASESSPRHKGGQGLWSWLCVGWALSISWAQYPLQSKTSLPFRIWILDLISSWGPTFLHLCNTWTSTTTSLMVHCQHFF